MFLVPPIGLTGQKAAIISPPAFIAAATATNGSGSPNVTVNKPSGTVDDDVMIFFWFGAGGGAADITSRPSGWGNQVNASASLGGFSSFFDCDTKVASSEGSSYQWSLNGGSEEGLACILTYRPAHATQLDASTNAAMGSSSSNHTPPNVTTIQDQAMVLAAYMYNSSSGSDSVSSPPSGMTSRVSINGSAVSRSDLLLNVYEEVQVSAGLYPGNQITYTNTGDGYGISAAIRASGT